MDTKISFSLLRVLMSNFKKGVDKTKCLTIYCRGGHKTWASKVLCLMLTLFPLPPPSMTADRMISAPTPPLDIARANHLEYKFVCLCKSTQVLPHTNCHLLEVCVPRVASHLEIILKSARKMVNIKILPIAKCAEHS